MKNMYLEKNKMLYAIALVLTLTIAASVITSVPVVSAAKRSVTGYISVSPKIVGLGQTLLVNAWISPPPLAIAGMGIAGYTVYKELYVVFTRPDGTTVTKGPFTSYQEGTIFASYVPDKLGDWKAKLTFAGDNDNEGTESQPFTFTVQQEPIPPQPGVPLPTGYWTRPINAENREWAQMTGEWMLSAYSAGYNASRSFFNPYSKAPETAHILWKHQYLMGGIIGGDLGDIRYGLYYPSVYPITMCGRVYYMWNNDAYCLDMQTGEELWVKEVRQGGTSRPTGSMELAPALLIAYDNVEDRPQSQFYPWLWAWNSSNIMKYDAFTGELIWNLKPPAGASFGATTFVPVEGYAYTAMGGNWSGKLVKWDLWEGRRDATQLTVGGQNFTSKIVWSKTMPSLGWQIVGNAIFFASGNNNGTAAMDTKTGDMLWAIQREHQLVNLGTSAYGRSFWPNDNDMSWHAYDAKTGAELWASEPAEYPWGSFWAYGSGAAYRKVYALSYDGHVYAFDADTGKTVWKFYSGYNPYTPYNTWPFWGHPAIADGKIYVGTGEHTMGDPMLRGLRLYSLNATTGDEVWSMSFGGAGSKAIADGKLIVGNEYDNLLYCFDKGQTATTVTASPKVTAKGSSVLIEGTITDQSPSQPGTPAIADESMSAWMEYLHMQKPKPTNATGVPVHLTAIDPNGNTQDIGTVTSDTDGKFSIMWTPPIEGKYTIVANFDGTNSYYSSHDSTALGVTTTSATPATTATPTATPTSTPTSVPTASPSPAPQPEAGPSTDMYIIAAAAVVIIVVVAVAALVLRKRK